MNRMESNSVFKQDTALGLSQYSAPNYDFKNVLPWMLDDRYYLQATATAFHDILSQDEQKLNCEKKDEKKVNLKTLINIAKRALKNGELKIAEQYLGKAIKKEKLVEYQSKQNPESYYYLAQILQRKADDENADLLQSQRWLLQAAALYNFVENFFKRNAEYEDSFKAKAETIPERLKEIQDSLVSKIGGDLTSRHIEHDNRKEQLIKLRDEARDSVELLNKTQRDLEKTETNEQRLRDLYLLQTKDVKNLCHLISSRIKCFLATIIRDCLSVIGDPPCDYEILLLGSLARSEMTPFSDFEWAILVSSEEEENKVFFRNLTNLVHLQIINLGETILPSMGIDVLNEEWFFDDITPRGISFDGFLPQACKTPLGNIKDFELIHDPIAMAAFQRDSMYEKNPSLAEILLTVAPLESNRQVLLGEYKNALAEILGKPCEKAQCSHTSEITNVLQCRGLQVLLLDVGHYEGFLTGDNPTDEGKLYDVKKEFYRLTDRVVAGLAKCLNSSKNGSFDILDDLNDKGILTCAARNNIASAAAIALKLRINTYLAAGKQGERLESSNTSDDDFVYTIPEERELFHFFYVAIPLYEKVRNLQNPSFFSQASFFDCSSRVRAEIYCRLLNYTKAQQCYEQAVVENPKNAKLALSLLRIKFLKGTVDVTSMKFELDKIKSKICLKYNISEEVWIQQIGELKDENLIEDDRKAIVELLSQFAAIHKLKGENHSAREIYNHCLAMKDTFSLNDLQIVLMNVDSLTLPTATSNLQETQEHDSISVLLDSYIQRSGVSTMSINLLNYFARFLIWKNEYNKAYQCLQRSLSMAHHVFGRNVNVSFLGTLLLLGVTSLKLLFYDESMFYLKQVIDILSMSCIEFPRVLKCLPYCLIALICSNANDHGGALFHLQKALELSPEQNMTILVHCSLATTWLKLGNAEKASMSAYDALRCVDDTCTDIQTRTISVNAVSSTFAKVNKSDEAISLLTEEINKLGSDCDTDVKASHLHELGLIYTLKNSKRQALSSYKECLEMLKINKTDISLILDTLLNTSDILHEESRLSEAKSMLQEAWGYIRLLNTDKAMFMKKIAERWEKMGENFKAGRCYREALANLRLDFTRSTPFSEIDLMMKLGDLAKILANCPGKMQLSVEQQHSAQRTHYDKAAEILRQHSSSGSIDSSTVLCYVLLANKYTALDTREREKLLIEALEVADSVYHSKPSEMTVSILCDLGDLYWHQSNLPKTCEMETRAFRMEMELHSSDPYHDHVWHKVSLLAYLYFETATNEGLEDLIKEIVTFFENAKDRYLVPNNYADKANYANFCLSMCLIHIALGDLTQSRKLYDLANNICDALEMDEPTGKPILDTNINKIVTFFLDLCSRNENVINILPQLRSTGLLAQSFSELRKNPSFVSGSQIHTGSNNIGTENAGVAVQPERLSSGNAVSTPLLKTSAIDVHEGQHSEITAKLEAENVDHGSSDDDQVNDKENTEVEKMSNLFSEIQLLCDSVNYDFKNSNFTKTHDTLEASLMPAVHSFCGTYLKDPGTFFITEALKCKENKRENEILPFLTMASRYNTLDEKTKIEMLKLTAESHFHSEWFRLAALKYMEAGKYLLSQPGTINVKDYLDIQLGLIRSHVRCHELEEALKTCEETLEFTSTLECDIFNLKQKSELCFVAARCINRLYATQVKNENTRRIVSYCEPGLCAIEKAYELLGPSDMMNELTGDIRCELFGFKCEIQLLLVSTFSKIGDNEAADTIVTEMLDILQAIAVAVETLSEKDWPSDNVSLPKVRQRLYSWIGRFFMSSGQLTGANDPLIESLLLVLYDYKAMNNYQDEVLDLLDAMTTLYTSTYAGAECFHRVIRFCKEKFLEVNIDIDELLTFLDSLANWYKYRERRVEAIVIYEMMLSVAESNLLTSKSRFSPSQISLFLGNCYRLEATKHDGKVASEELRLAVKYYRADFGMSSPSDIVRKVNCLEILCHQNRSDDVNALIGEITNVGDKLWDMILHFYYSSRHIYHSWVKCYLENHGEFATSVGCVVYSKLLCLLLRMGKLKEAMHAFEELTSKGRDKSLFIFYKQPSILPYVNTYCQKILVSRVQDKERRQHLQNMEFPLSKNGIAELYYQLEEYELALEYSKNVLESLSPERDLESETKLECLLRCSNALVLLGRGQLVYPFLTSFLRLLDDQQSLFSESIEKIKIIVGRYEFPFLHYVYRSMGMVFSENGDVDKAIQFYECLMTEFTEWVYKNDKGLVATLSELYQSKAVSVADVDGKMYQTLIEKAEQCFLNFIQSGGDLCPFMKLSYGSLLFLLGDCDKAMFHLENVFNDPDKSQSIAFTVSDVPLVSSYIAREIEAHKYLIVPLQIYDCHVLASVYMESNKTAEAKNIVSKMQDISIGYQSHSLYPLIRSILGYTYKIVGNNDKASEILRSVLEIQPDNVPVAMALRKELDV